MSYTSLIQNHELSTNRVAETLPEEVLQKMYAGPKAQYPVITLEEIVKYDAFIFGKITTPQ